MSTYLPLCVSLRVRISVFLHAGELGVSSLHVTFPTGEEWAALGSLGFQQRRGIQYHWENKPGGYDSFDDFLADLKQRKRKSIRQVRAANTGAHPQGWVRN